MSNPQTIPASFFVTVNPSVLSPGGSGLKLNGLMLTTSPRVPIGQVASFPDASSVGGFFGLSSDEFAAAEVYFAGFDNSNIKPGAMLFSQYPIAAVAAYLNGGDISGLTLAQLQGLTAGTLTLSVNGTSHTSSSINLSAATSFSNAAAIIQTALGASPVTVVFDSVNGGFKITSTTTGASSSITFATGAMATELLLTQVLGAYVSQGADATTPSAGMAGVAAITQQWATFSTLFDPDSGSGNAAKLAFADWTSKQNNRFAYIGWDTDITPTQSQSASSSFGFLVKQNEYSGTVPVYQPDDSDWYQAFIMGAIGSIDFTETQGRANLAFKGQAGLTPTVTSAVVASNLQANGYNWYGITATATEQFNFMYPGSIGGDFKWIDAYADQIWMNASFQEALMTLLTQAKSIPYNAAGYARVEAACLGTIGAALNFGAIQPGVTLSASQVAEVNNSAGTPIATVLQNRGWYLQIKDADPTSRAARSTPPCKFWYMDGGSINSINLASVDVQ